MRLEGTSNEKNNDLKGQDKIIEICKKVKADKYINAAGGTALYDKNYREKTRKDTTASSDAKRRQQHRINSSYTNSIVSNTTQITRS